MACGHGNLLDDSLHIDASLSCILAALDFVKRWGTWSAGVGFLVTSQGRGAPVDYSALLRYHPQAGRFVIGSPCW
ncbi:hypothetical protein CF327_g7208 [Tilletia walkeri]|nr:hypothetical protein CF327_g7208 [Tilletia walkeri]